MRKAVLIWLTATLSVCGVSAVLYGNHYAKKAVAGHIERSNQLYLLLSQQGDMPPIHMSYSELSANILTSSYTIHELRIGIAGMGELARIGELKLIGLQRDGLPTDGAAQLKDLRLESLALSALPKELSSYFASLMMEMSYQYKFDVDSGELSFQQELLVDHQFSLNYNFVLTGVSELWSFAEHIHRSTPEEHRQQSQQSNYLPDLMKKVGQIGVANGSLELENKLFLQQLFDQLAIAKISPNYVDTRRELGVSIEGNQHIPDGIRNTLLDFLKRPEHLKLSFQFKDPLTFSGMLDGTVMSKIEKPDDFVRFAHISLNSNSN